MNAGASTNRRRRRAAIPTFPANQKSLAVKCGCALAISAKPA
jgi:hypothetical protein